ncbi:MAG: nitrite/sulfite reductase [Deltaproteobacteria bacterium]|nr:nitrite/sulfite reductase [Deltaproteobacteria bacterium]
MYRYDQTDIRIVRERVEEYRNQVQRRIAGELTEDEFRPLRLMNGLYLQRHAYMLRIAVPYGLLSSAQMRKLAFITERYDRGLGHWTTRQNLQLNWIRLEDTPDILGHLADVEMHAIQTSGNCVRNITADPFAGVAPDELFDPRPWCEVLRQYTTLHPEFMWLPRKFKIAMTGAPTDRAAVQVHDIGVQAMRRDDGSFGWRVFVGGGLGRTPRVAQVCRDGLPLDELVGYCEAILRVYNLYGRRDNKFKARIKILVGELGIERFREEVEAAYAEIPEAERHIDPTRLGAIAAQFRVVSPELDAPSHVPERDARRAADPAFSRWLDNNVTAHAWPGYACVHISLKHPGRAPGDATTGQMYAIADLMDRFARGHAVATYQQNLVLPYVRQDALVSLYEALVPLGLARPNIGTVQDIICCPGLDYCSLANASSIPVAKELHERFVDLDLAYDLGPLEIKMSGCINACGHHHVGHIGILGIDKKGTEFYQIALGGTAGADLDRPARVGRIIGQAVGREQVVDVVERIIECFRVKRQGDETFLDTYDRIGIQPFQEAAYA